MGLCFGFGLLLVGVVLAVLAVIEWARQSFGPLDPTVTMRLFIPGMTAAILGVQTIFSSFFLSILALSRH